MVSSLKVFLPLLIFAGLALQNVCDPPPSADGMSDRLGLINPGDLTEEQQPVYDYFMNYTTARYGGSPRISLDDGTFIGPYNVLLHYPQAGRPFVEWSKALQNIKGLSIYAREVVIAVSGSRTQAAYEIYAHSVLGRKENITDTELCLILAGIRPDTLTEEGKAAFDVATALGRPGILDPLVWDRATNILGKDGTAAAILYTGFYEMVGVILNGFDVKVPSE